ncbi:hypothetical protein PT974_06991 [Cladobotryum mycophilum]|uniref:DDH domain-containing protein n=1 Tax=Cladobotryum mycophilum TaxID=491253 RepID=A0ABR0SNS2_9HYPO
MFFHDPELQLYINDEPLLISSKVQKAAQYIGLTLQWNQKGHVHKISYDEVKSLSAELGIVMLSVQEFMHLAKREPRMASSNFAEWLDDTYTLLPDDRMKRSDGNVLDVPPSRPGWFDLSSVGEDGLPTDISSSAGENRWKFWTQSDSSFEAAAVRGFVTSSGTCSLDLGVPCFARHPNLMIRKCYRKPPFLVGTINNTSMDRIWSDYEQKTHARNDDEIIKFFKSLDLDDLTRIADTSNGSPSERTRERLMDLAGKKRLIEGGFMGLRTIDHDMMVKALSSRPDANTTYVVSHDYPDADGIVSAVFEAFRRRAFYGEDCVVWLPNNSVITRQFLGGEISDFIESVPKFRSTNSIVLVDCHSIDDDSEHQVKAIIDHHPIIRTFAPSISISREISWSSTIQVYVKLLGSGFDLDAETAKVLLRATLVQAEPSLMARMGRIDQIALERLKSLAQEHDSYARLMSALVWETGNMTSDEVFMMDYRESLYGFAVIKAQQTASYEKQAMTNNIRRHLPLTIVKQVIYGNEFRYVVKEQLSMYFNERFHDKGFKKAILDTVKQACEVMHGANRVSSKGYKVEVTNVPHQTPRLLLAPLLEGIVREHLRFFWSKSIGMHVACGFFTEDQGEYGAADEEPSASTGVSFDEVKTLLQQGLETSFLSLPQYWQVYHECEELHDAITLKSLRDPKHIELFDTRILNRTEVINNDQQPSRPTILEAKPALIQPQDINLETGLPNRLASPNSYNDDSLWRYWSPDGEENVATRGHIFLLDRTCIDLKVARDEKTRQLTFRPVYRDIPDLKYDIEPTGTGDGKWVKVRVYPRLFSVR